MKPASFAFAKTHALDHLFGLLNEYGTDAQIIAGGQSLVASLNMRLSAPTMLIDINGISELEEIALEDDLLRIGALARHSVVAGSALVSKHAPLIAKAMPHIAHPAIRNRGTFGGSIALGDPAAEIPACVLALEAEIEIASRGGRRRVAARHFFTGLYETVLKPGEVVTAILIPIAKAGDEAGFAEIARRHGDYAIVGLAAWRRVDAGTSLAYFGVGEMAVRACGAEAELASGSIDDAVAALADDLHPQDDIEASGATRLHLAGVLLRRVVAAMAKGVR